MVGDGLVVYWGGPDEGRLSKGQAQSVFHFPNSFQVVKSARGTQIEAELLPTLRPSKFRWVSYLPHGPLNAVLGPEGHPRVIGRGCKSVVVFRVYQSAVDAPWRDWTPGMQWAACIKS